MKQKEVNFLYNVSLIAPADAGSTFKLIRIKFLCGKRFFLKFENWMNILKQNEYKKFDQQNTSLPPSFKH